MTQNTPQARRLLEEIAIDLDRVILGPSRAKLAFRIRTVIATTLFKEPNKKKPDPLVVLGKTPETMPVDQEGEE